MNDLLDTMKRIIGGGLGVPLLLVVLLAVMVVPYEPSGGDAAGQVIKAFGDFVIGGNYAVGVVVFAILVIINFVVVTKGAGRIAEGSAGFPLDAEPAHRMR